MIQEEGKQHYRLVKKISRLLSKQVTKNDVSLLFYRRCLSHFLNKEKLAIHDLYCLNIEAVWNVMPEVNDEGIKFKNHNHFIRVVFVIYADSLTESLTEPNSQEPAIYRAKSEDKDVAQIFFEQLEENIKEINNKS